MAGHGWPGCAAGRSYEAAEQQHARGARAVAGRLVPAGRGGRGGGRGRPVLLGGGLVVPPPRLRRRRVPPRRRGVVVGGDVLRQQPARATAHRAGGWRAALSPGLRPSVCWDDAAGAYWCVILVGRKGEAMGTARRGRWQTPC